MIENLFKYLFFKNDIQNNQLIDITQVSRPTFRVQPFISNCGDSTKKKIHSTSCVSMLDTQLKEKQIKTINEKPEIWKVESSSSSKNCRNFIREIVDNLELNPNPEKPVISLSIGDPTLYGNLKPSEETINAVIAALEEGVYNGYAPCAGYETARQAVADYLSHDGVKYNSKDIILCSGCSSSIDLCISALADPNKHHNILIPRPGFPLYRTLAETLGITVKYYNLIPEKDWEIDFDHLESQIDASTAVIVLNNPSNPCGSVYSEEHLRNFMEIAYKHRIPVIADEIYEQLVFPGKKFMSVASLHAGVPVLIAGGLAKRFLVPGWRLGWIAVHDEINAFEYIRKALNCLSQKIIGSNTLIQGALPSILNDTPQSFHDNLIETLKNNAVTAYEYFKNCKGLTPYMPAGTMYMMIEMQMEKFPHFRNGLRLVQKLMEEESVFILPGDCFKMPGFVRIVLTVPEDLLVESCSRIEEFCNRHYKD